MIILRPYQIDGENQIRQAFAKGFSAPLYVLPTGGGKTITFASISHSAQRREKRVLILSHRIELVDQIETALGHFGVRPDIIAAGYARRAGGRDGTGLAGRSRGNHPIAVASVPTLVRRLNDYPEPTLIIADEAHHATDQNSWAQIFRHYKNAKRLGVTATPIRLDGRGLKSTFDHMIVGPNVPELIALGFLVRPRVFVPPGVDTSGLSVQMGEFHAGQAAALMDVPTITGDALAHYRKHADGLPGLVFASSVVHAYHVAEHFRRAGVAAVALDGGTDREVRRMAVKDFREGRIRILASCDLFSEGFDVPGAHIGILLRPTASEGLFLQQVGRLLRPAPGKTHAIIFDHVGNTQRHGLPDDVREWELTADVMRKKKAPPGVRVCPKCFAASPARAQTCVDCGHVFEVAPRTPIKEEEGELVELTAEQLQRRHERQAQGMTKELKDLIALGQRKQYKNPEGWALHVLQAREAKKLKRKASA